MPATFAELMHAYAAALSLERTRPASNAARERVRDEYTGFAGSWACRGVMRGPADACERTIEATLDCTFSSNGLWLCTQYVERATAENPEPSSATDYWGYDEQADQLVRFGFGGANTGFFGLSVGCSRGVLLWSGVWLDEGTSVPSCDALQLSSDRLDIEGALMVETGGFRPVATLRCRRC